MQQQVAKLQISSGILGVDIGGVIIDRVNDKTDTSFFGDRYLETTAVPEAFRVIGLLVLSRFGTHCTHLVSKCGPEVEKKTLAWLQRHDFYARTGILPAHVHFCRRREEKAVICKQLGITHFVDDRLEVLSYLAGVPHKFLFSPQAEEVRRYKQHLSAVHQVRTWDEVYQAIPPSYRTEPAA